MSRARASLAMRLAPWALVVVLSAPLVWAACGYSPCTSSNCPSLTLGICGGYPCSRGNRSQSFKSCCTITIGPNTVCCQYDTYTVPCVGSGCVIPSTCDFVKLGQYDPPCSPTTGLCQGYPGA